MYIGDLCASRAGLVRDIEFFRSGTRLPLCPEKGEGGTVFCCTWPWQQVMTDGVDILIHFKQNCMADSLHLHFAQKDTVKAIELLDNSGACIARAESTSCAELSADPVLSIDAVINSLTVRLEGNMQDIALTGLELFGGACDANEPALFPLVNHAEYQQGHLPAGVLLRPVSNPNQDSDIDFCADYIRRFAPHAEGGETLSFEIIKQPILPANGYLAEITAAGIRLAAADRNGMLYGACTLLQLVKDGQLPICRLEDSPRFALRGVHLGLPPREEIPFFKRFLERFLLPLRYNTLFLQFTAGMRLERHPEINQGWTEACEKSAAGLWPPLHHSDMIAGGGVLEKDEVRDLVDFARNLGFEVIPEIQSLGHVQYMTIAHPEIAERADDTQEVKVDERLADQPPDVFYPHSYCPSNEESYRLLFDIMDEILDVVKPERFVHMGHDEVYQIGICPVCRHTPPHQLLENHIRRLHDYLSKRGLRMMMWADMLQPCSGYATADALRAIPKDIVLLDFIWYFHLEDNIETNLLEQGFEVVMGNLYSSHYPRYEQRAQAQGILGGEVSTWCRPDYVTLAREGKLFDFAYTAQMLWGTVYEERCRRVYTRLLCEYIPLWRQQLTGQPSGLCAENRRCTAFPFSADSAQNLLGTPLLYPGAEVYQEVKALPLCLAEQNAHTAARINAAPDSLLLLHACSRQLFKQPYHTATELGYYLIRFDDNTSQHIPILYGENIGPVHIPYGQPQPQPFFRHTGYCAAFGCDMAFTGKTPEGRTVTLYGLEWHNESRKTVTEVECILHPDCGTQLVLGCVNGIFIQT